MNREQVDALFKKTEGAEARLGQAMIKFEAPDLEWTKVRVKGDNRVAFTRFRRINEFAGLAGPFIGVFWNSPFGPGAWVREELVTKEVG